MAPRGTPKKRLGRAEQRRKAFIWGVRLALTVMPAEDADGNLTKRGVQTVRGHPVLPDGHYVHRSDGQTFGPMNWLQAAEMLADDWKP